MSAPRGTTISAEPAGSMPSTIVSYHRLLHQKPVAPRLDTNEYSVYLMMSVQFFACCCCAADIAHHQQKQQRRRKNIYKYGAIIQECFYMARVVCLIIDRARGPSLSSLPGKIDAIYKNIYIYIGTPTLIRAERKCRQLSAFFMWWFLFIGFDASF